MSDPFNYKVGDKVQFTIHKSNGWSHSFMLRTGVVYRVSGDVLTIKYRGRFYTVIVGEDISERR